MSQYKDVKWDGDLLIAVFLSVVRVFDIADTETVNPC